MTVAKSRTLASPQPVTERIAAVLADAGNHPGSGFPEAFTYRELARIAYGTNEPTPA